METRIIKAVFGASKSIVAPKRYKHDYGQEIEFVGINLPDVFEAHFSNSKSGQAKKQIGQGNVVTVPDEYFISGADVFCWVMVHDEATDGRTMYTVRIPVMERPEPINAEPTPVQQDVIAQAIAALNAAVEKTAQDVESADASAQSASDSADRAETARDTAEGYVDDVQGYAQQAQTSANNASASATASANSASQAQQIKTDVQGLVSDAQSAAGASAQSATESAQSASQASASATSASQSAETASTKASEASASAQTASTKATEASGYVSTASTKATEASQSASAASGYATAAGQAKTAAETAQGLAEQAQADAESAKDDAESARDTAQQIVSGISGKVEQIDQNTADIADLEADRYKAYATDTATGAVASFPDGADDVPMKSVKVAIEPVQDLNGQESPYPAGGGKNKLSVDVNVAEKLNPNFTRNGNTLSRNGVDFTFNDDGTIKVNGTATGDYAYLTLCEATYLSDSPSGTYILNGCPSGGSANTYNVDVAGTSGYDSGNGISLTYKGTLTNVAVRIRVTVNTTVNNLVFKPMIRLSTVTDGTFAPYSNICPISGWTGANVSHSGADTSDATVYSITFPTEAGTVYGGTLDVTIGVLTVDRANIASYNSEILPSTWISDRDVYSVGTTPTTGAQVVYKLATPITYQLTPTEIRSLLGTNNIFADTGDSTVEYRADTKLYIQKKITEAVSALA